MLYVTSRVIIVHNIVSVSDSSMAYQKQTCKVLYMASKLFITPLKGANKQDWCLQNKALAILRKQSSFLS